MSSVRTERSRERLIIQNTTPSTLCRSPAGRPSRRRVQNRPESDACGGRCDASLRRAVLAGGQHDDLMTRRTCIREVERADYLRSLVLSPLPRDGPRVTFRTYPPISETIVASSRKWPEVLARRVSTAD